MTTTKTQKLTREEIRQEERRKAHATRLAEFRTRFLKEQHFRLYTHEAAFTRGTDEGGDRAVAVLFDLVREVERLRGLLRDRIASAQRDLATALERLDQDSIPSWYSSGILGSNASEVDQVALELKQAMHTAAKLAYATGWRVRALEDVQTRAHNDETRRLEVVQTAGGDYAVRLNPADPSAPDAQWLWLQMAVEPGDGRFGSNGIVYSSADAAWEALAVVATGRVIE